MFPVSTEPKGTRGGIRAEANDLLFARITPCLENGKVALVPPSLDRVGGSTEFIVVRPSKEVLPKFLYYWSLHPEVRQLAQARMIGTTGRMRLSPTDLAAVPFWLTGTAEQSRVVAAIENAFSKLDVGEAGLHKVRQQLQRLREAVLSEALIGRMTNRLANDRPAQEILSRLGIDVVEDESLPTLPHHWAYASLGQLAAVAGGVTKDAKLQTDTSFVEVPYLRVANVQRGFLDLAQVTTIRVSPLKVEQLRLQKGDVLFNEGGDRDKLGRGWLWDGQIENCIHQNHVFRARLKSDLFQPKLVSLWGNSFGKSWFESKGKQTTNLASLNMTTLKSFPVPVAPAEEQRQIVGEIERQFSFIEAAERAVETGLLRSAALRRSILKAAFEGRLVPQDPTDEPASVLLERIRAERLASAATAPKKTRSKVAK